MGEKFIPRKEDSETKPKIEKLSINAFASEIGLQPDAQGRITFGPEHDRLAYEYAEKFARDNKAEKIIIDGVASPGVIASLLHGAHPAEGYVTYIQRGAEGNTIKNETKILEPLPEGEGRGPEGFTWVTNETDEYTFVEFALGGDFKVEDLDKIIPPEVNPVKPVIISGRGPIYLTHTIAAGYRHYKGIPAVGFYQPASKFGPAKTEIGISHDEEIPLGLNFGEPTEIKSAKEQYERRIAENLTDLKKGIEVGGISSVEVNGKDVKIVLADGESYTISVREVIKN
ncbi:MAG: CRISPR-associated protein Csx3 [Patescibacteria group bacterium]|nr:CRISPR-associated protein Csx3 [Patescibacteria group bacterium]